MRNDDVIITVTEYLDDIYGEEKLFGTDPMKKALQKLWVQDFEKKVIMWWSGYHNMILCLTQFVGPFYGVIRGNNVDDSIPSMSAFLSKLEDLLKQNGNFLFGDKPTAADYLSWPHVERLPAAQIGNDKLRDAITKEKFPVFYAWMDRMLADEAVKATSRTPEQHYNFIKKFASGGEHVYDLNMKDYTIHARKQQ